MSESFKDTALTLYNYHKKLEDINASIHYINNLKKNHVKSEKECNEELKILWEQKLEIENHFKLWIRTRVNRLEFR